MSAWKGKHNWTPEEDERLTTLIDSGLKRSQILAYFPDRTEAAVKSRCRVLRPADNGPSYEERCTHLEDAINALIDRMPANEVAEMIGKPHLKLVERAPYKTQSALRELAA